jgi:hypothetical protein
LSGRHRSLPTSATPSAGSNRSSSAIERLRPARKSERDSAPHAKALGVNSSTGSTFHLDSKKGNLAAPLFCQIVVSFQKRANNVRVFSNDSHRKSGAFSFGAALSPVESCSLRSSRSSRLACTPRNCGTQEKN